MTDQAASEEPTGQPGRWTRTLDAAAALFAVTTGALLAFAYRRDGLFAPFAHVGRRIARDVLLPLWADVSIGLAMHAGQSLALAALAVAVYDPKARAPRLRAALIVAAGWQVAAWLPWISVIRADLAVSLSGFLRVGLAALVVAALALGPRDVRVP